MESVQSANVDNPKFLALDEYKATTTNSKWNCCDITLKMLEEGVFADITFNAKGGSVKAHRSVLACVSPIFNTMFKHDIKGQLTSIVDMHDISIEALQLFLILLYTTNKVDEDDVIAGSQQMTDLALSSYDQHFPNIHKAVLEYQMPPLRTTIDKHFAEIFKASVKYQVERRLEYVLLSALARNLTLENCWYYYGSSVMIAPRPFKNSARRVCVDFILGNYHDVITSKGFLEQMRCDPFQLQMIITHAESQDTRKNALENYLRIKSL